MAIKLNISVGLTLISTALIGAFAPATTASAVGLTPHQTGEIDVGMGCIVGCIDSGSLFESIVSLEDRTTGHRSRLFVDYFGAGDTKQVFENETDKVVFKTRDKGTNSAGFWFRPSEYNEFTKEAEETGQLEVGTYRFNFAKTMANLTIDFFDTESNNSTGVLEINGQAVDPIYLNKGNDGNIQSLTFDYVDSIVMKLGRDNPEANKTGDGVNFRMFGSPAEEIPEPATLLGLLAVVGTGITLRKKSQSAAL